MNLTKQRIESLRAELLTLEGTEEDDAAVSALCDLALKGLEASRPEGVPSGMAMAMERAPSMRDAIIEECAEACLKLWRSAPNTHETGFLQNAVSHGCIASAEAIRKMKLAGPQHGSTTK